MKNSLKNKIHTQINKIGYNEIVIKLNYSSKEKAKKSLDKFLNTKTLYDWLKNGHYDLKYNSKTFLDKLCETTNIKDINLLSEIEVQKNKIDTLNSLETPYIISNVDWKRTSEPIFVLSFLISKKNFNIDKEIVYGISKEKERIEILKILKKHYKKYNGVLPIFGSIKSYFYIDLFGVKKEISIKEVLSI